MALELIWKTDFLLNTYQTSGGFWYAFIAADFFCSVQAEITLKKICPLYERWMKQVLVDEEISFEKK